MRPDELMIGDWVYNTHHKKNIQLTAYDFFTHGHDAYGFQYLSYNSKPTFGRDLEPIPLTAEIIDKNFETAKVTVNGKTAWCLDEDSIIYKATERYTVDIETDECNVFMFVDSVHELQHVLKLAKINKKIEL